MTSVFKYEDEAAHFIASRVARGTTIHADESHAWDCLRERYTVRRINHSVAYSKDGNCTNWVESFFSRMRRAEWGQYHQISGTYLARYAAEIGWREDHRREANGAQFNLLNGHAATLGPSVDFSGYWQRRKPSA